MIDRSAKIIWLVLITALVIAGCEQKHNKKEDVLAYGPDIETIVIRADYVAGVIEATGGLQNWTKIKKLDFDSVVTFYQPDDSFYLTEHHYEIHPWSNSIRISAQEPLSKFVWQLSEGRFSIPAGDKGADISPMAESSHDFAEAVLNITTAPVRFFDGSAVFIKVPTPVKIQGLWYYPIRRALAVTSKQDKAESKPYWSTIVFYQNKDSHLVDTILFADIDEEKFLAVRGYDYSKIERNNILFPTRIEIFRTDARGTLQERVAKIDFK